jgi:uncharacterized protein YajQ (UPF0234 family)
MNGLDNQTPSIYFEDDAQVMHRMIEVYGTAIDKRLISTYELDNVTKSIKAIADLIKAKADLQKGMIDQQALQIVKLGE